ncbi:MAG: DUF1549 domain-containing protein [Planctomycetia bacterium]|nr:DUF1549 domain-containing protein [Planctomycetia bacterium]
MRRVILLCLVLLLSVAGASAVYAAAAAEDAVAIQLPGGGERRTVDFERHVGPLLSRFGCNAAMCHGSFQGRGGLRLSLWGRDPRSDFEALSSRIDLDDVEQSLLVTKPTATVEHGGGERFAADSWPHRVMLSWIRQGAPGPAADRVIAPPRLEVEPDAVHLSAVDAKSMLAVHARWDDGSRELVTPLCRFESGEPGLAEVTPDAEIRALRPGAAHIVISYAGGFKTVPIVIPFPDADSEARQSSVPGAAGIEGEPSTLDRLILDRLRHLHLSPAATADDAQFLRRVTLDTQGRLPAPGEIHHFLADRSPDKRRAAIDRLLADPRHASLWATRLCDITGCRLDTIDGAPELRRARARMWHEWFRQRLVERVPFDKIVRGVIAGDSRDGLSVEAYIDRQVALVRAAQVGEVGDYARHPSLDLFWRRQTTDGIYPRQALAERIAASFLGVRIQCARCHAHPNDRWTQGDYASFVNTLADVTFGSSTELNRAILVRLDRQRQKRAAGESAPPLPRLQEVYRDPRLAERMSDPAQQTFPSPRPLGGEPLAGDADARTALADWLVRPDNPYFARNWANRVWAHYFGRGLVEPVDGFAATNPPTHPEVLDHLADQFVRTGYDLLALERVLLNSIVYQRTSAPLAGIDDADRYYACAAVRPMLSEALVQALDQALATAGRWREDLPSGGALVDVASDRPADTRLAYLFELFGRGDRRSVCDCDRPREPTLRQTLHLMSDAAWIAEIQTSPLVSELTTERDDMVAVENAWLRALSRFPSVTEQELASAHLADAADRQGAWVDLVWALVNSREFRTNH